MHAFLSDFMNLHITNHQCFSSVGDRQHLVIQTNFFYITKAMSCEIDTLYFKLLWNESRILLVERVIPNNST